MKTKTICVACIVTLLMRFTLPAETHADSGRPGERPCGFNQPGMICKTEIVRFPSPHTRFVETILVDQTDHHAELYRELDRPLLGNESHETNSAALFFLEDVLTGRGTAFLRLGPLPSARSDPSPDYALEPTRRRLVLFHSAYPLRRLDYEGGRLGRIRAAHRMQRMIRPYVEGRDGVFLTNTWGDGNRDGVINEAFMTREIDAGANLGVDVIQIDDGWQKGRSANSTAIQKGDKKMWGNFREDPTFWDFCPIRFPNGVEPLVKAAAAKGMKFGLWFGPDSSNEAAAWESDAERLLDLHRRFGVDYFKLDSMKTPTRLAQERQGRLFGKLLDDSNGKIVVDLDVTAGIRPGYFGAVASGPVFVENRYVRKGDNRRWYPHHTLRELWLLSHAVDPVRLRMEVLNPARLPELYAADDPLAPSKWPADALFAITMFASPLGWFEIQNLTPGTVAAWKPLVTIWKHERAAVQAGEIYPVGDSPDGVSWTGFVSARADGHGSALLFRELAPAARFSLDIGLYCGTTPTRVERIAGRGSVAISNGVLCVDAVPPLDFTWVKW